jgi:hypothetical protein
MPQDPNPELTPRYRMASAYDTARRRIMIYGGFDGNSVRTETFEYTGAEWQPIAAAGGSLFATEMYAAYDITRREFITFGGTGGSIVGFGNQTHEYTPRCTAFFSQYGEGCDTTSVGIAAVSVLDPDGPGPVPPSLPRLGQTYQMQFSNIPATTPFPSFVIVAVGLSNTSFNGLPLPFPLSVLGLPAECNLLCSTDLLEVRAAPSGLVTFDVPIPSNNALFNMPIYSQAIIGGPVLFPLVGASRGGVGVIGI